MLNYLYFDNLDNLFIIKFLINDTIDTHLNNTIIYYAWNLTSDIIKQIYWKLKKKFVFKLCKSEIEFLQKIQIYSIKSLYFFFFFYYNF